MTDITANVIVSMPSQLFTMARSFKAVANGKIYIGKIDTDPVNPENQIQVYVENEDGSHVPVSQPIIINAAGYPVYNGQIAKFVTVQGHSMAVYDAYGAQQFYFPNVLKYDPDQFSNIANSKFELSYFEKMQGVSFESGATITTRNQALKFNTEDSYYMWNGALPKVIPTASTPSGTGGCGISAWVKLDDATVRFSTGLSYTTDDIIKALNDVGKAQAFGYVEVPPTGLSIPRECVLSGIGQAISFAGDIQHNSKYFHKSGNSTIFLEPISGGLPNQSVDAVIYIDPKRTDTNIYAQKTTIENIAIQGDESSPNEYGLFALTGGNYTFKNIDIAGCKYGLGFVDVFLTNLERVVTNGAIQDMGGTSTTYINCWAKGNASIRGAWHIENKNYSSLIGCGSDGAPDGAYYFKTINSLVLTGCGAESAKKVTPNTGLALTFDTDCNMIVDGFLYRPRANDTEPLIVAGANNHVKINNFVSNVAVPYTSADIYVYGDGTVIEFSQCRFRLAKTQPIVHIEPGCTGKVVVYLEGGNIAVFTAGVTKESPTVEYKYDRQAFNPLLLIGGSLAGISYSERSGVWVKNGNVVTVSFTLTLSRKGSLTGVVSISNLPFNIPANSGGSIVEYANCIGGPFTLSAVVSGAAINLRVLSENGTTAASDANITNTTKISGTVTYPISGSAFNNIPL